ncbi:hypothetical protein BJX76DRAFT_323026 [Aspergillus varians]
MGQGSSQPADFSQNEDFRDDTNMDIAQPSPNSSPAVKRRKSGSQQEDGTPLKRKRKSSHSVTSPLAVATASPEHRPNSVKRKRLVDSLAGSDAAIPDRKSQPKASSSQKKPINQTTDGTVSRSQSRASSAGLLKRSQSVATRGDHKASPSPAFSTGDRQPKGRLNRANSTSNTGGTTGPFLPREVEALENFKIQFCNSNACSTTVFDLMVQHGHEGAFPGPNGYKKNQFWQQARSVLPNRDNRSLIRFMKRHFQASNQKPHEWTPEQEDELVALHRQHGPKWTQIADMIGRSSDDVVQRWKNRLEHRGTMNFGKWSAEEMGLLKNALHSAWTRMKAEGYDVGENIYAMDESLISWGKVSENMQYTRSRQQCADRWRRIRGKVFRLNSRSNSQSVSQSSTPALEDLEYWNVHRSAVYVNSDDDGSNSLDGATGRKKKLTPKRSTKEMPANIKSSDDESGSSSSSNDSDSSSESEPESKPESSALDNQPKTGRGPGKIHSPDKNTSAQKNESSSTSSSESESDSDSDDSSSEEDSESGNRSGNADEIPATPSPEPSAQSTSKSSKRKHGEGPANGAEALDDKRVKVKREPSPTPSAGLPSESSSGSESDSSESDIDEKQVIKDSPNNQSAKPWDVSKKSSSPSSSTRSSDSSDSEDELDTKVLPKVNGEPKPASAAPIIKQESETSDDDDANSTSSEETSDSDSDSDSDSK